VIKGRERILGRWCCRSQKTNLCEERANWVIAELKCNFIFKSFLHCTNKICREEFKKRFLLVKQFKEIGSD